VDVRPALERALSRLARALPAALVPLLGALPRITLAPLRDSDAGELAVTAAPLAAHSLLAAHDAPLLLTVEAGAVLRLVDRAYGGRGTVPDPLPDAFPLSAELMIARLEDLIAGRIAEAFELDALAALRRDGSLAQLAPFADGTPLIMAEMTVTEDGRDPWTIALALPAATLEALFGAPESAAPGKPRAPAGPADEPFADMPLELVATVIDMRMPFPAVAALVPGQLLPVAVARSVPLSIGGKIVAHGTIGALDDRVAVQITKAF
jgi:flagellar motor switch protein FliM